MNKKIGSMEFEEAVNELEKIVATLDEGNLSLKEASNLYMKGIQLKDRCLKLLESIELKLNQISPSKNEIVNITEERKVEL
jgi:exodeoxyribonuclease VII small subunit